jgi:hypothetical protein
MQYTCKETLRRVRVIIVTVVSSSFTHFEFVFVALGIYHVMHMRLIVICGLSSSTTFFHINLQKHDFRIESY